MRRDFFRPSPLFAIVGLMFIASCVAWPYAGERVPVHWNWKGEADRFQEKWPGLFLTPMIAAGLLLLFHFVPRIDPGGANFENFAAAWKGVQLAIFLFLGLCHGAMLWAATGHPFDMNSVMPLAVGVLFCVLGNYMGKLRPNWTVGVRTPWTLSSKRSWTQTHRQAGWWFIAMGIALATLGLWHHAWWFIIVMSFCGIAISWLVLYSYLVWRTDPDRIAPAGVTPARDPEGTDQA